jgi:hypothetical protein
MDYIFFAINALAAGLTVLLLVNRFQLGGKSPFRLFHYLGALAVSVLYYGLDSFWLSHDLILYYLGNTLPIAALIGALVLALHQRAAADR